MGNKEKKETIKSYYQGQNAAVSVTLESLIFRNFTHQPTMVAENPFQYFIPQHFEMHFTIPVFYTKVINRR